MRLTFRIPFKKSFIVVWLLAFICLPMTARGADDVPSGLVLFNDNGGWSWFQDERAIVDSANGKILVSSAANASGTDGGSRSGDIDIVSYDLSTTAVSRFVLHPGLQGDDHNSAAIWIRPDGRYVAMYGTHFGLSGGESELSRWRITTTPGDISNWSAEETFDHNVGMTYSNLHYLPNDNGGAGRVYNFVRSVNFDPNIMVSDDLGTTWSYGGKLLTEGGGGDRPYLRYFSDGNRIHFISTERHPRDYDNSIYHGYIENGQLFSSSGALLDANLLNTSAIAPSQLTRVFATGTIVAGESMRHAWTVDTAVDSIGHPVAVFQARASNDDTDHRFFYGRWDGSQWQVSQLAYAGSYLYAAENDYTGLVAIDPDDVNTVYVSSEVNPATKAQLIGADGQRHFELFKGTTQDNGATWSWTPITFNSTMHNVRPLVPKWDTENTALLWLRGNYSAYTNYDVDAVGLVNADLSNPELALAVDFGATGQTVLTGFDAFTRDANPVGTEQSEAFNSAFAANSQQITVTVGGGDVQFANRANVTSPIGDVAEDFVLLNDGLTLSFANLAEGNYQLVLYSHDRDVEQRTFDIQLDGLDLGTLNPVSGADPTIGVASSRVAFAAQGTGDVTFVLDGIGAGADVVLNGFELYAVGDLPPPMPPIDLNGDGNLDLLDFQLYLSGLHTDLSGLTSQQAFEKGDLNGDFQNNFEDFQLFKEAYDQWNGQGALSAALASVPEPTSMGLLLIGIAASRWLMMPSIQCRQVPPCDMVSAAFGSSAP